MRPASAGSGGFMAKADAVDAATMPTDRRKSGRVRAEG